MDTQYFDRQKEMREAIVRHGRQAMISAIIVIAILLIVIILA